MLSIDGRAAAQSRAPVREGAGVPAGHGSGPGKPTAMRTWKEWKVAFKA